MRGRLVTAACGLVLTVAFGAPAAAQAVVSASGPTRIAAVSCANMYDVGNGHYAGWDSSHTAIYFGVDLSHAIPWCNVNRGSGVFWIEENVNGQLSGSCLADVFPNDVTEIPCASGQSDWTASRDGTYHSHNVFLFNDPNTTECLYDDLQNPAIEDNCKPADTFEQFVWDALP
jgi:hypothetical protein